MTTTTALPLSPRSTTDDQILALAERIDAMPPATRFLELPARPGKTRPIKVERLPSGPWAAWNVGSENGRIVSCPVQMAEIIVDAYTR